MGIINSYERKAYKRLKVELLLKKVRERDERSKRYNEHGKYIYQVYFYPNPITQDEEIELRDLAKKEAKKNMYFCMFI